MPLEELPDNQCPFCDWVYRNEVAPQEDIDVVLGSHIDRHTWRQLLKAGRALHTSNALTESR